ncbi:hypothetical protein [Polyangium sorediatum]|uniref:DprA winged helix domain-containing protein n=1 Tax=Polyangium sorediatum TaxID=889274 RepID=A0ABT6NL53_9BACT|nr:hypothetical protein [Polyangium sorediatum]MDI1429045.1 hypothetical protein [Polyangium sorediatum]
MPPTCGEQVRAELAARGPSSAAMVAALLGLPAKRVEATLATLARDGQAWQSPELALWHVGTRKEPR